METIREAQLGMKDNLTECPNGHGRLFMDNDVMHGRVAVCYQCGFESHHDDATKPDKPVEVPRQTNKCAMRYPEEVKRDAVRRYKQGVKWHVARRKAGCSSSSFKAWVAKYGKEFDDLPAISQDDEPTPPKREVSWSQRYPEALRLEVVRRYEQGEKEHALVVEFGFCGATLQAWVKRYGNGSGKVGESPEGAIDRFTLPATKSTPQEENVPTKRCYTDVVEVGASSIVLEEVLQSLRAMRVALEDGIRSLEHLIMERSRD